MIPVVPSALATLWRKQQKEHQSSMTSGMTSTLSVFIAGVGDLFLKGFSDTQPDQRTVTQPTLAGNESRKTELLG